MKSTQIVIARRLWLQMRAQVSAAAPLEACGLIAGRGNQAETIHPIPNALKSPLRFRMEPLEQLKAFETIEESGLELLAIYHSHPNGPETPSETDLQESQYDVVNLIWSPGNGGWSARAFWLQKSGATEIPIIISE